MEERNNNEETVKIPVSEYKKFLKAQTRLEFLKDYTSRSNYSVSREDEIQGNETPLYMLLHFADLWAARVTEDGSNGAE